MPSRHLSRVIHCPPQKVYDFAADPRNLHQWAAGLASDVTQRGDDLVVSSPMGEVTVRFAARNDLGVLDHDVTLPTGTTVNNPVRVLPHPEGSEMVFTIRQLDQSDDEFDRDTGLVEADLDRLKALLESSDT